MFRAARSGLLALALAATPAVAQVSADTASRIDRVFAAIDRTDQPGCVLGINRDGAALYRRGYGMANLELGVPMSERSVVESGSVAKQFTAGMIVHLALAGRLGLDDPVRRYVPELPDYGSPITIRMLLNHTSGIRDMWTLFGLAGQPPGTVLFTMDRALQMVYRQRALNFPPNSRYLYSNSGYLLLADIVRRVSGKSLADYARETYFGPLGMTRTQWRDDWNRVVQDRTTAYSPTAGGFKVDMPFMSVYGAGGLLTTVGDLLLWNEELSAPRIAGRAWADSLVHRGRLTDGRDIEYALGLIVGKYRDEREISHTGATGGYRTYLGRLPDRRLSLAVLCNYGSANPESLAHQVVDVFLGTRPAAAAAATAGATTVDVAPFVGRYRAPESEATLTLANRDGKLVAEIGNGARLEPDGPNAFRAAVGIRLKFADPVAGKAPAFVLYTVDSDSTRYERTVVPASTAADLARYAGWYHSDELEVDYRLTVRDTSLALSVAGGPETVLVRTGPDSFSGTDGTGLRFTGQGTRIGGLLLFAGRVRNLRFVKRVGP